MLSQRTTLIVFLFMISFSLLLSAIVLYFSLPEDFSSDLEDLTDPSSLSFSERWYFNASLDKSHYFQSDNLTLTVNLTCLVSHNVTAFNPGWFRWLQIRNSSNVTMWHPFIYRPEIVYGIIEFHQGDRLGPLTSVFQIGPTTNIPSRFDINLTTFDPDVWDPQLNNWIPALPLGNYFFIVDLGSTSIMFNYESPPSLSLPFIIIN